MTGLIPIAEPHTPDWHALRKTGIGSSDAAGAVGLSEYSTPLEVYLRKTGELADIEPTEAMEFGTVMESAILRLWQNKTGQEVEQYPCPMFRHSDHKHMIATPDAQLTATEGVEVKSLDWRLGGRLPTSDGDELTKDTPDYLIQAQHQLAVTGWDVMWFAVLVERRVRTFVVQRNEELIAGIVEREAELWQRIVDKNPPEPDWEHKGTPGLIRDLYDTVENDDRIVLSTEAAEAWEISRALGRDIRELEKQREVVKSKVLLEIGEHYAGVLPGGEKMVRRKRIVCEVAAHTKDYISALEVKCP